MFFIRSPWGQGIVVKKAVSYLSDKTGTEIRIDRLFVTFRGDLHLEGFYVEDLNQDTLVYSKKLETGLALKSFITKGEISVSKLEWEGVKAIVKRDSIHQEFNFDFIIKAFAGEETGSESVPGESSPFPTIALGPVDLKDVHIGKHEHESKAGEEHRPHYGAVEKRGIEHGNYRCMNGDVTL